MRKMLDRFGGSVKDLFLAVLAAEPMLIVVLPLFGAWLAVVLALPVVAAVFSIGAFLSFPVYVLYTVNIPDATKDNAPEDKFVE